MTVTSLSNIRSVQDAYVSQGDTMKRVEIAKIPDEHICDEARYFVMVDESDKQGLGVSVYYLRNPAEEIWGWDLWFPSREICIEQMLLNWGIDEWMWEKYTGPLTY